MPEGQKNKGGNIRNRFKYFRGSTFTPWDSPALPQPLLGVSIINLVLYSQLTRAYFAFHFRALNAKRACGVLENMLASALTLPETRHC